jgi:hypothetical protein
MADQHVILVVFDVFQDEFEAFEHKVFAHLAGLDRRLEALEQTMNSRFDELVGKLDALAYRPLRLKDDAHS